jgi:type IV secretory pathway VirJ component
VAAVAIGVDITQGLGSAESIAAPAQAVGTQTGGVSTVVAQVEAATQTAVSQVTAQASTAVAAGVAALEGSVKKELDSILNPKSESQTQTTVANVVEKKNYFPIAGLGIFGLLLFFI